MSETLVPLEHVRYVLPSQTEARLATWLHGRPATTAANYRHALTHLVLHLRRPLAAITLEDLQGYADALAARYHDADGAPTSTVATRLAIVRSFFRFALRQRWIASNPAELLRVPRVRDRADERVLDEREAVTLVALARGRDRVLLRVLYVCGLRVSELCALRCRDLVHDGRHGVLLVFGKGERLRRIPIPSSLYADLVRTIGGRPGDAPLFAGRVAGRPLTRDGVLRLVRRCARAAGLPRRPTPHWLRHAHGAHAERNGATISQIQRTLGHADIRTTMRYLHPDPDDSSAFAIRG